ncbi:uncharacterized protein [Mycetomoellerius zeteki]|uniref:uncharacterized protein n=1 Tax=Mycetomoellerius zeteki TaxID=64791 RepID=UPI00084E7FB8|nr:PREDICTED: uncharacterized protein LOC108727698 [Trachymyrmex zeteki]XP_018311406.1 PREDICTED: uncharacterized protein LOC108727698 [Trachymyrmex zeteki]XP_018311407.1 PREDICTED: uncharacterized protein LOC108727698 [Trachymyrmex zeteki]
MSLCPSSSHQLVAAAIAFRRARRKFPKNFGLESTVERASGNTKTQETTTSREGPISQVRSSSTLVRRAYNSRSDHVCPASVRNHDSDYDRSYNKENSISCSCYRTRNVGEDISELRDECSGGDAVDTVPSREREEFASSDADRKNEFVKSVDRDRCDVASRSTDDSDAVRSIERIPQSSHPTSYHHCKARCPSRPCSNVDPNVNPTCDSASCEKHDKVACGDFTGDRSKELASTSCHGTSIDLGGNAEEDIVTSDTRGHSSDVEDTWTRANTLTKSHSTHRKIVDSTWRCQCECHPCEDSIPNLSRSSCDRCRDECYHRHNYHCNCSHRHCCCPQRDNLCINIKGCETRGSSISGEKAQHKSWRDQMRDENSRLYARQCYSKEYSGIIPTSREGNDEEERKEKKNDDDDDDEDDDDSMVVINHKDSMCILAEKYKASRKWRRRRCGNRTQSDDRTGDKDECNKSLTSEIIDQPGSSLEIVNAVSHEGPMMRHSCRAAHCENCETVAIARTCGRVCGRHEPPEGEFDRLKSPLNETAATRCCSNRPPCRRVF